MRAQIFKSHRVLAKLLAIPMLLWALSGLMHPFIANWFKPEIANPLLAVTPLPVNAGWQEPAAVLKAAGITNLVQLHAIKIEGSWMYQVVTEDKTNHYFDALSGARVAGAEQRFAAERAAAHAGLPISAVKSVERVDSFENTYRYINRYLPVYRVSLDTADSLQVYIDPLTQKMASFSTMLPRAYRVFFAYAHNWSFLGDMTSPIRVTAILVAVVLITWVGIAGLTTYLTSLRWTGGSHPPRPLHKRLHRTIGVLTSVLFLMLAASGVTHVLTKYRFDWGFLEARHVVIDVSQLRVPLVAEIGNGDVTHISLASIGGEPFYRLAEPSADAPGGIRYVSTVSGLVLEDGDALYARELGAFFAGVESEQVGDSRLLAEFGKTYPGIQKRLPVRQMKVSDGDYMGLAVDTAHAHLATRITPIGLAETMVFLNLHKFHFLDGLSKEARDWLSVVASMMMIFTLLLGVNLALKRRALRRSAA